MLVVLPSLLPDLRYPLLKIIQFGLMEDMLYSKDLYDPVEGHKSKDTKSDAEWKKLNRKAVALIR